MCVVKTCFILFDCLRARAASKRDTSLRIIAISRSRSNVGSRAVHCEKKHHLPPNQRPETSSAIFPRTFRCDASIIAFTYRHTFLQNLTTARNRADTYTRPANGVVKFRPMHFQRDINFQLPTTHRPGRARRAPPARAYRLNQQFFHEVNPLLSGQILTFLSNCN